MVLYDNESAYKIYSEGMKFNEKEIAITNCHHGHACNVVSFYCM